MDLPCLQWQHHVAQKWTLLDPELKQYFTSLLGVDDVFKCALSHTTQEDLDFLQSISEGCKRQKDAEEAARCRERGNSSFKSRKYTAAALHYSQGVCFAPQSSEQLSLCYANRSAALYHLQRYQECLDDIDRALKHGYPPHLQHKLQDRSAQCLHHLSMCQKGKLDRHQPATRNHKGLDRVERPTVKPIKKCVYNGTGPIDCISPQVAVGYSLEKGRHLVVTDRIAAGEVILKDRPYSCILIPGKEEAKGKERGQDTLFGTEDRHCHRCLSETVCPVPCEGCSYSCYCSNECQQAAWEEHHRWECPLGADLVQMGVMSQLALRVTLKAGFKNVQMARGAIRDKDSASKPITEPRPTILNNDSESNNSFSLHTNAAEPCALYYGDSYLSVYHLLHHLSRHSPSLRFLCAVTVATLYLKLSRAGLPPASWDLRGSSGVDSQSQSSDDESETADWSPGHWLLGSVVLRHMLQLRCNAQAVTMFQDTGVTDSAVQSNREIRIATAIFPTLSLLNHSCCPNTSLVFSTGANTDPSEPDQSDFDEDVARGVVVTVRAAKDITHGQEVLHCYGPHSSRMAIRKRQCLLQQQYYFLCECEACCLQLQEEEEEEEEEEEGTEGSWQVPVIGASQNHSGLQCGKCNGPLKKCSKDTGTGFICPQSSCGQRISYTDVSRRLQEVSDHLQRAVELMERDKPDKALLLLQRAMSQSGLILSEIHPLQGELADAMARAYAAMGDWNSAASELERSAVAIGSQYGEDSIELGRQLFKLAQLHFNGGAVGPALCVIPKVRRLLSLHCGSDCPELNELQAMEDCLRG
ncbi:protein-lysine N-methyltransferase SMYD4 [Myripristis murdjan]|uniref:Protein-lysine N-methyltransferase SMYD4 n=1 Tax=Myripristis murdjan TaxID=586833 RepID=A0A667X8X7_9TELE|nr:SET and MYND domain-containing protein 4 [Myripristis murdjan]